MRTVDIPNIDIKVWNWKSEFPQGNYMFYLTHSVINRKITFKLMDIEYDQIKYKITRMGFV